MGWRGQGEQVVCAGFTYLHCTLSLNPMVDPLTSYTVSVHAQFENKLLSFVSFSPNLTVAMWTNMLFWAFLLTTVVYVCVGVACAVSMRLMKKGVSVAIPVFFFAYAALRVLCGDAIACECPHTHTFASHRCYALDRCIYTHIYTHSNVHAPHTHPPMYMHSHKHTHTSHRCYALDIHSYTDIYTVYIHTCIHTNMHTPTKIHVHAHTHTHTHTQTHTHIPS